MKTRTSKAMQNFAWKYLSAFPIFPSTVMSCVERRRKKGRFVVVASNRIALHWSWKGTVMCLLYFLSFTLRVCVRVRTSKDGEILRAGARERGTMENILWGRFSIRHRYALTDAKRRKILRRKIQRRAQNSKKRLAWKEEADTYTLTEKERKKERKCEQFHPI